MIKTKADQPKDSFEWLNKEAITSPKTNLPPIAWFFSIKASDDYYTVRDILKQLNIYYKVITKPLKSNISTKMT